MTTNRLLLLIALFVCGTQSAMAQIVTGNCWLQGQWLEIGMGPNGAFGASPAPAGYHKHCDYCWPTYSTGNTGLAEVYDYGHDGWTVGSPAFMGDYTLPGSPQEGWSIQVNGQYNNAWQSGGYFGTGSLTGSITTYSNTGGRVIGNWEGTAASGGLTITQETRIDTLASWVVVTTYFHNTTSSAISNVFYERTCDPDNDQTWPGGGFATTNRIVHQNDADHRVLVSAIGASGSYTYMGLGTKDCRAKCFIIPYSLTPVNNLSDIYNETGGASSYYYTGSNTNDEGYGIVWNLGTIAAGDSTIISYSYIFNGDNGIDSALPDPELVVGSYPVFAFPDTLNGCAYPGVDSVPVDILYGDDKDWSWSSWTWSPATGLASTTGVHNFVHLDAVPGDITYTVTGIDSGAGMKDCANITFVFTVHSCHFAYANSPCLGDAIMLGMRGDSIGATYQWSGPGGYTSYVHDPVIFPSIWADSGMYYVIRTIGGINDTDSVHVTIHPLPAPVVTSNIPYCGATSDTLRLFATADSAGETFEWSGPFGFNAQVQNPVWPFDTSRAGTYVVTATTIFGCRTTASIDVYPGAIPVFTPYITRGCFFDSVSFSDSTFNADTFKWSFGDGDSLSTRYVSHVYAATTSTVYTVSLTVSNPHCTATLSVPVDTRHSIKAAFWPTPDTFCLGYPTTFLNNTSTSIADPANPPVNPGDTTTYLSNWDFGDGVGDTVRNPSYTYTSCGHFYSRLVVVDSIGCMDSAAHDVYVINLGISSFTDTTLCISQPLPMTNIVTVCPADFTLPVQYVWTQSAPNLSDTSIQNPTLSGYGLFVDTLTISYPGVPGSTPGCAIRDTVTVHSVAVAPLTGLTASTTISYGSSIQLNASGEVIYYWTPNDGSLDNPSISDPIATPTVTTMYTVYGHDVNGCIDSAYITISVDTSETGDMPSGFTPNHDGNNDVFRPVGNKFAKMVEFRVFNRWGEAVFSSANREDGWDGTYHGVPQDMGTYFYEIIVATPGGSNKTYKGNVTLIR